MSSTTEIFSSAGRLTTIISTPSATSSNNNNNNNQSNGNITSGSFYKNLFYILIGLLAGFGVVSLLSLLRARHRRNQILREADRLGVLVPGVPGYIPYRDRQFMSWAKSDGTESPDWWEVERAQAGGGGAGGGGGMGGEKRIVPLERGTHLSKEDNPDFLPLAIVPDPPTDTDNATPPAQSSLPFFPNHLAYRPASLLPPPPRFTADRPETLDGLGGEDVDVVTIIQMPMPPEVQRALERVQRDEDGEDVEAVLRQWAGTELGISRVRVVSG